MTEKKSIIALQEEAILEQWQSKNIFAKTLAKEAPQGSFVFFEGPPTANGKPGIHHIEARAYKDVVLRYKTMQGFKVERKAGWDTHGLPVELQVEKELGISGKPQIENLVPGQVIASIKQFNAKCKESVWSYKNEWEEMTKRIGFWLDLADPYVTYQNEFIESVWWFIKQAAEKDLLYKGFKVVPYCARCGTTLSSHEVAQGYQNIKENSVYLKFKITAAQDKELIGASLLVWTTTPWTLPGNLALAVGKDIEYIKVKRFTGEWDKNGKAIYDQVILAKEIYKELEKDPALLRARPFNFLFTETPEGYEVTSIPEILGTFRGSDLIGTEYQPLFNEYENNGQYFKVYAGDFVSTTDGTGIVHIAPHFGEDDFSLFAANNLVVPERITVDGEGKLQAKVPGQGKFVKEADPEIIEELKAKNILFKVEPHAHDYPFCWRCNTPLLYYARTSWFIRVSALRSELNKNNEQINWHPDYLKAGRFGEWLKEAKDWAISRERYWGTPLPIWECVSCKKYKVIGSAQELLQPLDDLHRPFIDEATFKCECSGEMKRVPEVCDVWMDSGCMPFAQWGYPAKSGSAEQFKKFYPADYIAEGIDQTRGWFYTLLTVATILGFDPPYKNVLAVGIILDKQGKKMSKSKGNTIEPWFIADKYGVDALRYYLYTVNQCADSKNFDEKDVDLVVKKVILIAKNVVSFYKLFANNTPQTLPVDLAVLDQWILSRLQVLIKSVTEKFELYQLTDSHREIGEFINDLSTWYIRRSRERFKGEGKISAQATLREVLLQLSKLLAPGLPFLAEEIYQAVGGQLESVHLETWPEVKLELIDEKLITEMAQARTDVEKGLALRAEANLKVRQPLTSFTSPNNYQPEIKEILAQELNVLEIIKGADYAIDTNLTPELKQQGLLRELVRQINTLRKELKLTIQDQVTLQWQTADQGLLELLGNKEFREQLAKNVLANEIIEQANEGVELKVNELSVKIKLEKV
ncbi:MAG: isoleucine--tRNA ligase [Candidatus Buchananbacteria bacterium]